MIDGFAFGAIAGHGVALCIAAPFAGAALAVLAPGPRASLAAAVLAALCMAAGAAASLLAVQSGPLVYAIAPGFALRVDGWSATAACWASATTFLALMLGAGAYLRAAGPAAGYGLALALSMIGAAMGMAFAADLASFAAFIQVFGLCMAAAAAVGAGANPARLSSGMRAGVALGLAGALVWFGAALALARQGGLDAGQFMVGANGLDRATAAALILACVAGAAVGLVAPFNQWASALLSAGPGFVAMLAVGVGGPIGVVAIGRFSVALSGTGEAAIAGAALVVLGATSAAIGVVQALAAKDVRRLAGYAFSAHAGAALVGLALGTAAGAGAALLHLMSASAGALLLLAAGARTGAMAQMAGAGRRAPFSALAAALGCFVFMGAPLTIGFASTWLLLEALLEAGWWAGAALVVGSSLAAVAFGGRLLERLYFRSAPAGEAVPAHWPVYGVGLFCSLIAVLAMGFAGAPMADLARAAGAALVSWRMGSVAP